ncbi:MAG: SsrA-binding protein SmpB [Eubacteriales bacterium]|nr:SsrA-binding protein SmpB [Eubacteriales bacterium]
MSEKEKIKIVAQNKKARHDYFVEESYEAGIELKGTEVKSIRLGNVNLKESYAQVRNGEIYVLGMHISPYKQAFQADSDPARPKRLLLHKREIRKIAAAVQQKGYTLIPLKVYLKHGLIKVELGVCIGKRLHDKRDAISRRDAKRAIDRAIKSNNKVSGDF